MARPYSEARFCSECTGQNFFFSTVSSLQPIVFSMAPHVIALDRFGYSLECHEKYSGGERKFERPDDRHPGTCDDSFALSKGFVEKVPTDIQKDQVDWDIHKDINEEIYEALCMCAPFVIQKVRPDVYAIPQAKWRCEHKERSVQNHG
jgi:hypothetical protein